MTRERRLQIALALNVVIVVVQTIGGVASGSLGLLADAGHNLSDVAAIVISLIAVRLAMRPATPRRSFGWHRSTILAAQANAAAILVVSILIMIEGLGRLRDPQPVDGLFVLVVAMLGLVANSVAAALLYERGHGSGQASGHGHGHDLNMRSAMLHSVSDAAASAGVAVAGGLILVLDGWYWLDPAVSMAIAVVIAWRAVRLLGETADVLLESTPAGLDTAALAETMTAVAGVESIHDLHVWSLSSDLRALAAHLVLEGHPTLEEAQVVGERVKQELAGTFAIAHATLELECEACPTGDDPCGMDTAAVAERARDRAHAGHHH